MPENETATFETLLNKDKPVKWFKNTIEIHPDQNHEPVSEGPVKRLILRNVKPEDTSDITCKVDDVKTTAKLTVKGNFKYFKYHEGIICSDFSFKFFRF